MFRLGAVLAYLLINSVVTGATEASTAQSSNTIAVPKAEALKQELILVDLLVSLTWDEELPRNRLEKNLRYLRQSLPGWPILHLLRPVDRQLNEAYQNRDEYFSDKEDGLGLYFENSLMVAAKAQVPVRTSPTFWGHTIASSEIASEARQVPLTAYKKEEVQALLKESVTAFEKAGWVRPRALQVRGWMAGPAVLSAAAALQFEHDLSAVDLNQVAPKLQHFPIFKMLRGLWNSNIPRTRPYWVNTHDGRLMQWPAGYSGLDYGEGIGMQSTDRYFGDLRKLDLINIPGPSPFLRPVYHYNIALSSLNRHRLQLRQTMGQVFDLAVNHGLQLRPFMPSVLKMTNSQ